MICFRAEVVDVGEWSPGMHAALVLVLCNLAAFQQFASWDMNR